MEMFYGNRYKKSLVVRVWERMLKDGSHRPGLNLHLIAIYSFSLLEARWLLRPKTLNRKLSNIACHSESCAGRRFMATAPENTSGTTQLQMMEMRKPEITVMIAQMGTKIANAMTPYRMYSPHPSSLVVLLLLLRVVAPVRPKKLKSTLNFNAWISVSDAGSTPCSTAPRNTCGTIHPHTRVVMKAEMTTKMAAKAIKPRQLRPAKVHLSELSILLSSERKCGIGFDDTQLQPCGYPQGVAI